jgi:hypothetical protein
MYISPYLAQDFGKDQIFTRVLKYSITDNFKAFDILNEKLLIQSSKNTSTEVSVVLGNGMYVFTDVAGNFLYGDGLVMTQVRLYLESFTTNYSTPLRVSEFKIMSEEELSEDDTLLALTSDNYYSQKFFEEFPFLPITVNTFMGMLEERPAADTGNVEITSFTIKAVEKTR